MATKEELMLELEAIIKEKNPKWAKNIHAAMFGVLCAVIKIEDIQKAIDIWSYEPEKEEEASE